MADYRYPATYTPSVDQIQRWQDRLQSGENAIDWLWRHVAPDMAKRRRARTCALLTVASPLDRNGFRGRSHLLLYDESTGGTGKSALGDWLKYTLPDAGGVGPSSSEAGLKYNANLGEPGMLHLTDGGLLRIEEFEKFDKSDRNATFEAMSEGEYEVTKGATKSTFPAETRVVALTNGMDQFSNPLQTRFDYAVEMSEYGAAETITVAHSIQDTFRDRFIERNAASDDPVLLSYLNWCWEHDPGLSDDVDGRIRDGIERLVETTDKTGEIRNKEGYLRTAYTISRLNKRDIQFADWLRAVDIMEPDVDVASVFDHTDEIPE